MKKWIICQYGEHHIPAPHECKPIGMAYQIKQGDPPDAPGFISMEKFEAWLLRKNLCAFGADYAVSKTLRGLWTQGELPVLYRG